MQPSAEYVRGDGQLLLRLYEAIIKMDTIYPRHQDIHRLRISYDDFKKGVDEARRNGMNFPTAEISTSREFFKRACSLVEEVAARGLATEAIITSSLEVGGAPLDVVLEVVRTLFPTTEQTLQTLILDNIAITPSEPSAAHNANAVDIKRLQISNSPNLFAQPELLKQLIGGCGKIGELVLVGGPGPRRSIDVDANALSRSASTPQVNVERIILEFPEGEFPGDLLETLGFTIPSSDLRMRDTRDGGVEFTSSEKSRLSRAESPLSATPMLGGAFSSLSVAIFVFIMSRSRRRHHVPRLDIELQHHYEEHRQDYDGLQRGR